MSAPPPPPPESGRRKRLYLILGAALGVVAVTAVLFFLWPRPTPEEVARQWASNNADAAGESIAAFILDALGQEGIGAWAVKELAGEWIEDRINEHLFWTFSPAAPAGDGSHIVVATASVDFQVDYPPLNGNIKASLPFRLLIKGSSVLEDNLVLADAGFQANLAGIDSILNPGSLEAAEEKAEEALRESRDKLKNLLGQ